MLGGGRRESRAKGKNAQPSTHSAWDGSCGSDWKFTSLTIVRVAKARRLERDLDLNLPGLAVVLDLLDQIDDLRVQLKKHQSTMK